jgi:hypothetical protein
MPARLQLFPLNPTGFRLLVVGHSGVLSVGAHRLLYVRSI